MTLEEVLQLIDDLLFQIENARDIGVTNLLAQGLKPGQANNNMTIRQLFEAILLIKKRELQIVCECNPVYVDDDLFLHDIVSIIFESSFYNVQAATALSLQDTAWPQGRVRLLQLTDTAWAQREHEQEVNPLTALSLQDSAWAQREHDQEVKSLTALSLQDSAWPQGRVRLLQLTDTAWAQREREQEVKPLTALSLQDTARAQREHEQEVKSLTALSLQDSAWPQGRVKLLQLTDTAWVQREHEQEVKPLTALSLQDTATITLTII